MAERALSVARLGFLAWAVIAFARGDVGSAIGLLAVFAIAHVPRALDMPLGFEAAFLAAWTLQELGSVEHFWSRYPWWDTLVHTALPSVLAPTALVVLVRFGVLPDVLHPTRAREGVATLLLVMLIAAGFGVGYEIFEWTSDSLGTTTFQPDNGDTMTDMTANLIGGTVGAIALMVWALRRQPAAVTRA
jgi:hypothetical protein